MSKHTKIKGEVFRKEEQIANKTKVAKFEEFYGFRMPDKSEEEWANETVKHQKIMVCIVSLLFFILISFFLSWFIVSVLHNEFTEYTIKKFGAACLFCILFFVFKIRSGLSFKYDITILDCKIWSVKKRKDGTSSYNHYAAIYTDTQYSDNYIFIQNYVYHQLINNPDEKIILVKVFNKNKEKSMYYLEMKKMVLFAKKDTT